MASLLDMRTVLLSYVVSDIVCVAVMAALWAQNRRRSPEIGLWLTDFLMQLVALLLIVMRGLLPDFASMVVSNTLVVGGTVLLLIGLERYLDRRGPHVQDYVMLATFVAVQTYFTVVQPNLTARNINISVALLIVSAEIAWLLLRRTAPEHRRSARSVALVFLGYALVSAVRVMATMLEPHVDDLFKSGAFDTASIMSYQMLYIGLTFALFLLVNGRLFDALQRDVAERERTEATLRLSEQKFSMAFHNVPDAIVLTSAADGRVIEANDAFFTMAGLTREEVQGQSTIGLGVWADIADRDAFVVRLRAEGRVLDFDSTFRRSSGEVFPGSASGEVIDIGGEACVLTIVRDLTERKRAEDEILRLNAGLEKRVRARTEELTSMNEKLASVNSELTESNAQLEEATRAKSDFLAAMSHELRTPLNSIIGFSGVLVQGMTGPLDAEQRKQVQMINVSGRHLLALINGVLDLAKVESGQAGPTIESVDVGAIAREMLDTVGPMAEAKPIEMRWQCPDKLKPTRTDRIRVDQILLNLLGNAVKFTESGFVATSVSQDGTDVLVAVQDSGPGIAAKDIGRVFDDFYQVVPRDGGKSDGTGLGLAVSRRLAESIGASIEVTSELGRGSVFTLRIPDLPL